MFRGIHLLRQGRRFSSPLFLKDDNGSNRTLTLNRMRYYSTDKDQSKIVNETTLTETDIIEPQQQQQQQSLIRDGMPSMNEEAEIHRRYLEMLGKLSTSITDENVDTTNVGEVQGSERSE
jgi:hypothetical protein